MKTVLVMLALGLSGCLYAVIQAQDPNVSNRCPNKCLGNGQWVCCELDGGALR